MPASARRCTVSPRSASCQPTCRAATPMPRPQRPGPSPPADAGMTLHIAGPLRAAGPWEIEPIEGDFIRVISPTPLFRGWLDARDPARRGRRDCRSARRWRPREERCCLRASIDIDGRNELMIAISQEPTPMTRFAPLLTLAVLLPLGARAEMMTTHRIPAALASRSGGGGGRELREAGLRRDQRAGRCGRRAAGGAARRPRRQPHARQRLRQGLHGRLVQGRHQRAVRAVEDRARVSPTCSPNCRT